VGIAGEDDLDAPDLGAAPKAGSDHSTGPEGKKPNGHALTNGGLAPTETNPGFAPAADAGPPLANRRRSWSRLPAKPLLASDKSAALRDRLVAELDGLHTADQAADSAHRSLPAKNTLTAADAELVEAGFSA
jgi:hypothetical protein